MRYYDAVEISGRFGPNFACFVWGITYCKADGGLTKSAIQIFTQKGGMFF
jgi:hypothetical protein